MPADELKALAEVRGFAGANRVIFSDHARKRLRLRGAQAVDAVWSLAHATSCVDQRADALRAGDWKVTGPDLDGDDLSCAVILDGEVLVVTVF